MPSDADSEPVAGAEVVVQANQGTPSTAISDATGRFEIVALESGEYQISARAVGFSPVTERVTGSNGQPTKLTLQLPEVVRERVNVVGDASLVEKIPGSATVIDRKEIEKVKIGTDDIHQCCARSRVSISKKRKGTGYGQTSGCAALGLTAAARSR